MKKGHKNSNTIFPTDKQRPLTYLFIKERIVELTKDMDLTPDFSDLEFMETIAEEVRQELGG